MIQNDGQQESVTQPVVSSFHVLATETAQQLKKTAGVPFHAKGRGLVKKIDTTSELKTNKCTHTFVFSVVICCVFMIGHFRMFSLAIKFFFFTTVKLIFIS